MTPERVLYIVVCGAPLAARIRDGVEAARECGWRPIVIPTAAARAWATDELLDGVEVLTGHRQPGEAKRAPEPDAILVVPATFNTLTAWANGTANTYPLVTLCAALGRRIPIVAVPFAKHDLAGHPAWLASLAVLRNAGVTVVDPSSGVAGAVEPVRSGAGEQVAEEFQWTWALRQLTMNPNVD